jgi:CHASE3 domain sensor protein
MNSFIPSIQELREMLHLASNRATWVFFAIPIFLLLGIGVVADRATSSFAQSEYWVSYTHEVREKIESLRAELFLSQDSRNGYVLTGNGDGLAGYTAARQQVPILTKEWR